MDRLHQVLPLVLLLVLGGVTASLVRLSSMAHFVASETYEDVYYLPPADRLPLLSLGWDEALADLLWTRALVYFGEEMTERGALRHVFDYTDAMLALDPDFRAVYRWIATAGLYRPQATTADDARTTIEYLRRGHARFPNDGELAWILGAALAYELPPLLEDPAERDDARAEGAEYLMLAARRGAGPEWLALSSATLLSRAGRAETAARHLEDIYYVTDDESARARLAEAIARLRSSAYAEALVESNRVEEERRAQELPYVTPALYQMVQQRAATDWREAYHDGFAHDALADERDAIRGLLRTE